MLQENLKTYILGNKVIEQWREDPSHPGQVGKIKSLRQNGQDIQNIEYTYDDDGNMIHRNNLVTLSDETFDYDELDQLKRWEYKNGSLIPCFKFIYI